MKQKIPKALREQVWVAHIGKRFVSKCHTPWCNNTMTVFDFQCGHNVPESKGGSTDISNLVPICSRCNLSMSDDYTFTEWAKKSKPLPKWKSILQMIVFPTKWKQSDIKENGTKSSPNPMNQKDKHTKLHGILSKNKALPQQKPTKPSTKTRGKK